MLSSLILFATANAGGWQIARTASDGKYYGDLKTVDLDFALAGMSYAAPYHVYHKLIESDGFMIPVDSNDSSVASYNAEFTVRSWEMTVKDSRGTIVSSCESQGEIETRDCDDGNWCSWYCNDYLTSAECEAEGFTEGCDPAGGDPWVKKCTGGFPPGEWPEDPKPNGGVYTDEDGNECFSNDNSCCRHSGFPPQWISGAQFCNTIWMQCDGTPKVNEEYSVEITLNGVSHWNPIWADPMSKTIKGTYVHRGEPQAYVGAYSCEQPYDDSTQNVCSGVSDLSKWQYSEHPEYQYNEYAFDYPAKPSAEPQSEKIVGAYWTEWAAYKRYIWEEGSTSRRYYVQNTPFHQLTHLLYAFIPVCGNGSSGQGQLSLCVVNDCASEDPSELQFGNPYFNLRARACKFDSDGNEAKSDEGGNLDSDFELAIHDPWSAFHVAGGQLLAMESAKQQYPDIKILPSIGGWTLSKMFFHMKDSNNRAKFVESCRRFLTTWKVFDGIDIDWEFPGGSGQDDGASVINYWKWPADNPTHNTMKKLHDSGALDLVEGAVVEAEGDEGDGDLYALLMKDLRVMLDDLERELGRDYRLTSAISGGVGKIAKVPYGELAEVMDNIFVMSYDFDGAWSQKVGHQTNLYQRNGEDTESCARALEAIADQGFPKSKIAMGVGMYGRGWAVGGGAGIAAEFFDDDGQRVQGTDYWGSDTLGAGEGDIEAGVKDYGTIASGFARGECTYFYDECAQAPLAKCGQNVWTYDNPRSVKAKGDYVVDNGYAGLFAWVLDQDNGEILNAMHEAVGHQIKVGSPVLKDSYPARPDYCSGVTTGPTTTPSTTTPSTTTPSTTTPSTTTPSTTTPSTTTPSTTTPSTTTPSTTTPSTTTPSTTTPSTTTPSTSGGDCVAIPGFADWEAYCIASSTKEECDVYFMYCTWTGSGSGSGNTSSTTTTSSTTKPQNPGNPGECGDVDGIECRSTLSEWECTSGQYWNGGQYNQYYWSTLCPATCASLYPSKGSACDFYSMNGGH